MVGIRRVTHAQALQKLIDVFSFCGISYLIGGSVASARAGEPRATNDIDILADLRREHVEPFVTALQSEFYVDRQMIEDSLRRHRAFNILHLATFAKIDIFTPSNAFHHLELQRALPARIDILGEVVDCRVATPEDILLAKLVWYRLGSGLSEQQWRDISGIVAISGPTLDHDYLRHWAAELAVSDLLERALNEKD